VTLWIFARSSFVWVISTAQTAPLARGSAQGFDEPEALAKTSMLGENSARRVK
jgi:hypothetical protein